jgi:hypothetical protein
MWKSNRKEKGFKVKIREGKNYKEEKPDLNLLILI